MAVSLAQVYRDALALSREEREQLAEHLLESLATAEDGAPLGASWKEVERRLQEIENGVETIPVEEVMGELRRKYP